MNQVVTFERVLVLSHSSPLPLWFTAAYYHSYEAITSSNCEHLGSKNESPSWIFCFLFIYFFMIIVSSIPTTSSRQMHLWPVSLGWCPIYSKGPFFPVETMGRTKEINPNNDVPYTTSAGQAPTANVPRRTSFHNHVFQCKQRPFPASRLEAGTWSPHMPLWNCHCNQIS